MISTGTSQLGAWSSVIDPVKKQVRTTLRGRIKLDHVRELQEHIRTAEGFDPEMDHIVDCREMVSMDTPFWNFRSMYQTSPFAPHSRQAVVIRSSLGYGTARAYQNLNALEPSCFQIFDSMDEAERWLAGKPGESAR